MISLNAKVAGKFSPWFGSHLQEQSHAMQEGTGLLLINQLAFFATVDKNQTIKQNQTLKTRQYLSMSPLSGWRADAKQLGDSLPEVF